MTATVPGSRASALKIVLLFLRLALVLGIKHLPTRHGLGCPCLGGKYRDGMVQLRQRAVRVDHGTRSWRASRMSPAISVWFLRQPGPELTPAWSLHGICLALTSWYSSRGHTVAR